MRATLLSLLSIAGLLTASVPAQAAPDDSSQFALNITHTTAGQPLIEAAPRLGSGLFFEHGSVVTLSACTPNCRVVTKRTITPALEDFVTLNPGPLGPGTILQAEATLTDENGHAPRGVTVRTGAWKGRITNTAPPALVGRPRVGQTVTATVGAWKGGWPEPPANPADPASVSQDTWDVLGFRACRTRTAKHCVEIRAPSTSFTPPYPPLQAEIRSAYSGWYVGAYESRDLYVDTHGRAFPLSVIAPVRAPRRSHLTSFSPLVHVHALSTSELAALRPSATVFPSPQSEGDRLAVASVHCPEGCVASTGVSQLNERAIGEVELSAADPYGTLTVPSADLDPGATIRVKVYADGQLLATRRVRAP